MKTRNLLYSDFTLTFSNKGSLFPQTIRCPILSCPWFLCWLCFWSTLFSLFLFCLSLIFPPLHLSLWEYKQVQHLQNLVIDRFTSIFFFLQVLVFCQSQLLLSQTLLSVCTFSTTLEGYQSNYCGLEYVKKQVFFIITKHSLIIRYDAYPYNHHHFHESIIFPLSKIVTIAGLYL